MIYCWIRLLITLWASLIARCLDGWWVEIKGISTVTMGRRLVQWGCLVVSITLSLRVIHGKRRWHSILIMRRINCTRWSTELRRILVRFRWPSRSNFQRRSLGVQTQTSRLGILNSHLLFAFLRIDRFDVLEEVHGSQGRCYHSVFCQRRSLIGLFSVPGFNKRRRMTWILGMVIFMVVVHRWGYSCRGNIRMGRVTWNMTMSKGSRRMKGLGICRSVGVVGVLRLWWRLRMFRGIMLHWSLVMGMTIVDLRLMILILHM